MADLISQHTHQPCDSCGSSDALTVNTDGSTKCFSCGEFNPRRSSNYTPTTMTSNFIQGDTLDIPSRKINRDTCKRYGYAIGVHNGEPVHIANYRNMDGAVVAQKYRTKDKGFRCQGTPLYFFGQHLNPNGGKRLVITEGEIDCLTVSQVFDNKWPVVSLPSGAQSAKLSLIHI